jgi:hypothetical protein
VTEHCDVLAVAAESVQLVAPKLPEDAGAAAKVTVPLGDVALPAAESVTVAVHVDAWFSTTEAGLQVTAVVVERTDGCSTRSLVAVGQVPLVLQVTDELEPAIAV